MKYDQFVDTFESASYINDLDAFVPEIWAAESLMILQNNKVASNLVHQDFSDEVAQFGDVINTRRPANFQMQRKGNDDTVVVQDADAPNLPVTLDQHLHTSFLIKDGEESKGFQNLVSTFLEPALISLAQGLDEIVVGMAYQFLANSIGSLGVDPTKSTVLEARKIMNQNQVPQTGRQMVLTPGGEAALLNVDLFLTADKVGDDGTALREASLSRKLGFDMWMDQNTPSVIAGAAANDQTTGAVNLGAGFFKGDTTVVVDGFSSAIANGTWVTFAGDDIPQRVISTIGGGTPTSITFAPGLSAAIADDAVVTAYTGGLVNNVAGYPVGATPKDGIVVDGFTIAPQTGQLISFNTADDVYSALTAPTTTRVDVNRALKAAIANNDVVGVGPAGDYNFFFHRNAVSLVTRPLAPPLSGTGALASVASANGTSVRVVITYDGDKQGHLVTVDLLAGIEVLDLNLGGVMLG